jgi:poly(A) polymerase
MRLKLGLSLARAGAQGDTAGMRRSARLSTLLERAERYRKPAFPFGGADVVAAGVPSGKRVGEILTALEEFWIERNFIPDRAALAARLGEMIRESL